MKKGFQTLSQKMLSLSVALDGSIQESPATRLAQCLIKNQNDSRAIIPTVVCSASPHGLLSMKKGIDIQFLNLQKNNGKKGEDTIMGKQKSILKIVKKGDKFAIRTKGVLQEWEYVTWDGRDGIHTKGEICLFDTKEKAEKELEKWTNGISQWVAMFEELGINCNLLKRRI